MSGILNCGRETGLSDATAWRCPKAFGVGLSQRVAVGDQSSVSSAGGSPKKRMAVVRKAVDTQEYESCQQHDMDVDVDEARRN